MKRVSGIVVLFIICSQAHAGVLYVPSPEYSTIQSAINDAGNGDVIIVGPDTYSENINLLGKAITITSTNPYDPNVVATTIIDGSQPTDANNASVVTFNSGEGNDCILTGFTITGGTGSWLPVSWEYKGLRWNRCGGGVVCYNMSSPTISKNVFVANSAGQGGAIYCYGDPVNPDDPSDPAIHINPVITENSFIDNSAIVEHGFAPPNDDYEANDHGDGGAIVGFQGCDAIITGNTIENNHADLYGGGIHLRQWSNGLIENNRFIGNDSALGGGIHVTYSSSPTIHNNLIKANVSNLLGGGGIYVYYLSNPLISHNLIYGNSSGNGAGLSINYTSAPTVENNLIINNEGVSFGGAIKCTGSDAVIRFNTIFGNSANYLGAGISCLYSSSPTIEHNLVVNCKDEPGIYVMDTPEYPASPVIKYNNLYGNDAGNYGGDISDQTGINGNISIPPNFANADANDFHLNYDSECINAGDPNFAGGPLTDYDGDPRKMGDLVDIGADEAWPVWNITSGEKYDRIQPAIDNANNGDTIIATANRYFENLNFHGKNVELRSIAPDDWGVVERTIIDGNGVDTVALFESGENQDCILAGFTITAGQASTNFGGGLRIRNFSSPTIKNNLITYNAARRGAGICLYHSSAQILNNRIVNNSAVESGLGGGMIIIDCLDPNGAVIANNIIAGNRALYAGGIRIMNSTAIITNNVIAYNRGEWAGMGVYGEGDTIENCIVWGNGDDLYACTATYSCIENDDAGQGNISDEPNFVDPGYWGDADTPGNPDDDFFVFGNYHILLDSPCVNAGDNSSVPPGLDYDMDGEERIFDDTVDIGADEAVTNPADFNTDGIVDFLDVRFLTDEWLTSGGNLQSDLYEDQFIDFFDYGVLAGQWQWKGGWYQ